MGTRKGHPFVEHLLSHFETTQSGRTLCMYTSSAVLNYPLKKRYQLEMHIFDSFVADNFFGQDMVKIHLQYRLLAFGKISVFHFLLPNPNDTVFCDTPFAAYNLSVRSVVLSSTRWMPLVTTNNC